jgi:hypothetical protein
MKRMFRTTAIVLVGLVCPTLAAAQASTPQAIKVQGYLTQSGAPVNGPVTMEFTLYDADFPGGTNLGAIAPQSVTVSNGIYEIDLPFQASLFAGASRYLEITVNDQILTPRMHLASAPFAYQADTLDGFEGSAFVKKAGDTMTGNLSVQGAIESSSGGFRFPDGTSQTSAADSLWKLTGTTVSLVNQAWTVALGTVSIASTVSGNMAVSGYVTDAGGALRSSYTYVVAPTGGDYTSLKAATDACYANHATGCTIHVKDGTYTETAQVKIGASRTRIILSEGAVVQANGSTISPLISASTTGLYGIRIEGGKIGESSGGFVGTAIDLSNVSNSVVEKTRIEGWNLALKYTDTANATFYNSVRDAQLFNNNNCIEFSGTQPNANMITGVRCRPKAGGAGTGLKVVDTRGLTVIGSDFEPGTGTGITGVSIDATSREITLINNWIENNDTGLSIASGANRVTVNGGSITSNLIADVSDAGTRTAFMNTSITGVNRTQNLIAQRWLKPFHWSPGSTSQAFTAGTEICALFEVQNDAKLDNVTYVSGGTVAGNVKAGIFGPIPTEETSDGAALLVQSATFTPSGTNAVQAISLTPTLARMGRYYVCLLADDSSNTYMRQANQSQVTGWLQTKAGAATVASGFQATMSTPSNTGSNGPSVVVRVAP